MLSKTFWFCWPLFSLVITVCIYQEPVAWWALSFLVYYYCTSLYKQNPHSSLTSVFSSHFNRSDPGKTEYQFLNCVYIRIIYLPILHSRPFFPLPGVIFTNKLCITNSCLKVGFQRNLGWDHNKKRISACVFLGAECSDRDSHLLKDDGNDGPGWSSSLSPHCLALSWFHGALCSVWSLT